MSAVPKHKYTIEEYIEFDKNTDGKWEYFDGEVLDMAGGSLNHNRIARNLIALFEGELRGKACEVLPSDMRIKVPKALPYRYADVVVVCEKPAIEDLQGQEMLVNPLLIVEVLSPTTEGYDYGAKFIAYQSIESFREYLLVSQERPHVTHYVRQPDDQWLRNDIEGMEKTLRLATVDCELELGEIYRLVEFSAPEKLQG
jgi:Uma2 family endonuclease